MRSATLSGCEGFTFSWTNEYGIYRLTIDAKVQKEIRPVFHEELDFFGLDQYWDYPKDTESPILAKLLGVIVEDDGKKAIQRIGNSVNRNSPLFTYR